ncbi:DUF1839 family protein [Variovorax dokdonensis]|uniref:DUF1839 family protein n=1 Tax=Variovorax dokdonensis TaxID=344883 RepID=A0ABT7NFD1_9BURK|nr:DUF1839 family protein [Variovorax dokdonensis]MDM0046654.1 DUF1839 family protein [Variovorax dokdonensis]
MNQASQDARRARAPMLVDAARYVRHPLHGESMEWTEKNCYTDHWIELLHANGLAPQAMLPFVIDIDFEGDQWTFFKPPLGELRDLYGARVNELTVWLPLVEHALTQLALGRYVIADVDSFWLPDTQGTGYREKHGKTSIVLQSIDMSARRLGYFHNAGYFELSGEDFEHLFRLHAPPDETQLPPYAEIVRFDGSGSHKSPQALRKQSRALWRKHLRRASHGNPVEKFAHHFSQVLPQLQSLGLEHYNDWAFANIRQMGAACELAASSLQWLGDDGEPECPVAAQAFTRISGDAKSLIFLGARAVASGRRLDPLAHLSTAIGLWDSGMAALHRHFETARDDA